MRLITRVLASLIGLILLLSTPSAQAAGKPKRGVDVSPSLTAGSLKLSGDYWALIIGIDKYKHVDQLESPVKDATALRDVLVTKYGFSKNHVTMLLNEQATREGIEDALYQVGKQVGPDDSLLIYYAGHGQTDPDTNRGFWVPVDGKAKSPGTLISNARIRDEIEAMKAKHVYLVADSCFSGSLFGKARALPPLNDQVISRLYADKSRWGLTSGRNEPVADDGKGGHSIFAYFFLKLLKDNNEPYLVPDRIGSELTALVGNNSGQVPRSQPLYQAGDEGGQFVFRLVSATGGPVPTRPAPSLGGSPTIKDVDVSAYDQLEALTKLSETREQAWNKVKSYAGQKAVTPNARLSVLDRFVIDFPADNPHVAEVEMLKLQIQQEIKVAKQVQEKPALSVSDMQPDEPAKPIVEARLRPEPVIENPRYRPQDISPLASLSSSAEGKFSSEARQWQRFSLDDLEREWRRVKQYAEGKTDPAWRLAAVQQFKGRFPNDNPYLDEADRLIKALEREKEAGGKRRPQIPNSMQESSGVLAMRPPENLKVACGEGQGQACQELGWRLELSGDDGQAANYYRQGCTEADPLGCLSLGRLSSNGRASAEDYTRASDTLQRACEAGRNSACGMAKSLEAERRASR